MKAKTHIYDEFSPRVTVTSALPYVNGVKHLGNVAGSLLPADVFHRFLDMLGVDNIFICGTDDHGTAVEIAAEDEDLKPEELVKKYWKIQKDIYGKWNIDFTYFGQTSSSTNHELTKSLFLAAHKNGYVLQKDMVVPYCENCLRYLPDRYIIGTCPVCGYDSARGDQCEACSTVLDPQDLKNPRCNVCGQNNISFKQEKHLFLDYPLLATKLEQWIVKNKHWPDNTRSAALGWIRQGLKPRCITRNISWGVRVPLEGFEHLVFYVWFDAPIGYISITKDGYYAKAVARPWKEYWTNSKIYHFLGKDNIPFHTIFWPGTLIAARDANVGGDKVSFSPPYKVVGYEYLNWGGEKFSTSRGIGLFSDESLNLFPADYWRFYLSYILPESKDSNFDWSDFQNRINNELIANYGNLFYRVTHFIKEHFGGKVPKGVVDKEGEELYKILKIKANRIEKLVRDVQLKEALKEILLLANEANKYFQGQKPWHTVKIHNYEAANTLFTSVNLLRSISILLHPYIPSSAEAALKSLGVDKSGIKWEGLEEIKLKPGSRIEAKLLFKKIEDKELQKAKRYVSVYSKKKEITETKIEKEVWKPMIKFEDFNKLDLVVGTITDVNDHPNAEKLFVMNVDLGKEIRQVVAGLKGVYKKEELSGRQVIVVANLEPKELRGVRSHGMLLAGEDGTLVSPVKKLPNGTRVK